MVPHRLWPYRFPKVEKPYVPWIVVGAEPGADTTVVHLYIKALVVMVRGKHWANWLAWCIFTMLAEHRNESRLHFRKFTLPIPLNPNPLNRTTLDKMVGFIDGDVVLGLARHYAGLTACAVIGGYRPAPFSFFSQTDPPESIKAGLSSL